MNPRELRQFIFKFHKIIMKIKMLDSTKEYN